VARRIHLSNNSPNERSPGGGKGDNEETSKGNEDLAHHRGSHWIVGIQGEGAGETVDHEADEHPQSTVDQSRATTNVLYDPEATEGSSNVNRAQDDGRNV